VEALERKMKISFISRVMKCTMAPLRLLPPTTCNQPSPPCWPYDWPNFVLIIVLAGVVFVYALLGHIISLQNASKDKEL
jgi:hypothetical protein